MRKRTLLAGFVVAVFSMTTYADEERHRVKGKIDFSYDYAETMELSKRNGKPVFAYFTFET